MVGTTNLILGSGAINIKGKHINISSASSIGVFTNNNINMVPLLKSGEVSSSSDKELKMHWRK